jgi:hypothetical protein
MQRAFCGAAHRLPPRLVRINAQALLHLCRARVIALEELLVERFAAASNSVASSNLKHTPPTHSVL